MKYLLVLYVVSYGFKSVPIMQWFDTAEQCETVRKHVTEEHGSYWGSECLPVGGKP